MASEQRQVYKCAECGAEVEVLAGGEGTLVCCKQPMELLAENTTDAAVEKHVPVIEKVEGGVKVTVGQIAHPMADDHWIEWIELLGDGVTHRKQLSPGDAPQAVFSVNPKELTARALCNLHGLWRA